MVPAPSSSIETAIENQPLGGLQIRVTAICALIQMCDGYDVGSIGWAVPSLTHAWHVAPPAFALAFLWSNLGVMAGALASGPIGDRFGRKPLLLGSIAIFGLASLASAFAPSLGVLSGLRVLHRARDRRRVYGDDRTDRRLHAAAAARDDDHGDLHRSAARRFSRRSGRGLAATPGFRLAGHLFDRRRVPARAAAGHGIMAAGIATLSRF
jgi:MFS family permease